MHPAPSIIVFTTLSGVGFGLIALLSLGAVAPGPTFLAGAALAVALASVGLVASLFHLGHPERAWRAFSQWRSSWLSREGVLSIATLAAFALLAALRLPGAALGLPVAALALATVYATAMIYASLRSVPNWHHPLTAPVYLAFSLSGGTLLAAFLARLAGQAGAGRLEALAALLLGAAWTLKLVAWSRGWTTGHGASSPETATGLGPIGRVRLFEPPHTGSNYLLKEMVFTVARRRARALRRVAVVLGGALPLLLVLLSLLTGGSAPLLLAASLSHLAGLFAERWLFFAEARHLVGLYYGEDVRSRSFRREPQA